MQRTNIHSTLLLQSYNIKDIMFTGENICGPGIIRSFLNLPDTSDEELSKLTDILCSLNGDQIKQFVAGVVPQLDLKDLVRTVSNTIALTLRTNYTSSAWILLNYLAGIGCLYFPEIGSID